MNFIVLASVQIEEKSLLVVTENEVTFYLYNQASPNSSISVVTNQNRSMFSSGFDKTKETLFIIHGWISNYLSPVNIFVKTAVLNKYDVNVIIVNWEHSYGEFAIAVNNVGRVGIYVGEFIRYLSNRYDYPFGLVRLVGFSLGAHICGVAGKTTNGLTKSIIGLDPSGPLSSVDDEANRLAQGDSTYVEVSS